MTGLTPDELELMEVLADAANRFARIVGHKSTRDHDISEAVDKIHQLQAVVMSQAAARAHPDKYRLLGEVLR